MLYTHFCSSHLSVGWLPIREHFPQRDSIAPHITRMGKCAIVDGLRSIPAAGEQSNYDSNQEYLFPASTAAKCFFDQTLPRLVFFSLLVFVQLLFKGGYNLEGSVCFCGKFFGKPITMGVQNIQWWLFDAVSSTHSLSVLLSAVETSSTTQTASALARWSSSEIHNIHECTKVRKLGCACTSFTIWAWLLPYSGKLSRKKTFANFASYLQKLKFGGMAFFGTAKVSNHRKFSPRKSYFLPIRESFLPWKVPAIQYSRVVTIQGWQLFVSSTCTVWVRESGVYIHMTSK